MNGTSVNTRAYEKRQEFLAGKDKRNQSQFAFLTAENAEFAEQEVRN
jgi:hypothetical protein